LKPWGRGGKGSANVTAAVAALFRVELSDCEMKISLETVPFCKIVASSTTGSKSPVTFASGRLLRQLLRIVDIAFRRNGEKSVP
jgi:hypothetical protein